MKGCYCLIINMKKDSKIKIGRKLGKIEFRQGYYVYVGSAMNSLIARIERHLSDDKKMHWHVDYLLKNAEISDVIYNQSKRKIECDLSRHISTQAEGIKDFGCSDCECESHLYYFKTKKEAVECVESAYDSINMKYEYY
ncbi:MAG: GIY-YIG nuclease family protein [Methanobrevibacter sp.]|uniref:GIY-YIG nuclease family protein n=1 Tax=Methanobrevibacter sp. TaxID=66852 RepID=UPI002E797799|nr:GIY-YIG nuclease family protein [Methanobrevibacter sp.]MEE0936384.1 GIY-YIG nuclease family protein [Methanobrevibacter sp.]